MKSRNYKYILFFITVTVLATIGLQIFWNIKNYNQNKSQLITEVQTAFDNSIEYYYVEDSKNDFMAIVGNDSVSKEDFFENLKFDTVFKNIKRKNIGALNPNVPFNKNSNVDKTTVELESIEITEDPNKETDSLKIKNIKAKQAKFKLKRDKSLNSISAVTVLKGKKASDSVSNLKNLVNKIIISMVKDSIEFQKLSTALDKELKRKNIEITYNLQHFKADTLFADFRKSDTLSLPLSAISISAFLPKAQKLKISFSDPTFLLLKRSLIEILLSSLLSLSVLFCLLYLLRTINKRKKIDEIKNDLISNITHEFKTPITIISTAIEGIKNFNALDDKEKTNRYLDISTQQLKKLEVMVEKLLETASLNTNQLILTKELVNIVEIVKANIEKHQLASEKKINVTSNLDFVRYNLDVFHFENVISNLIDNAVKYGGSTISVAIIQSAKQTEITVEDDGNGIEKSQREKIFDQFYRIPKGNIHDVKGFGIGLYYAKKIIEKHNGTLELVPNSDKTIFKIILSNAN